MTTSIRIVGEGAIGRALAGVEAVGPQSCQHEAPAGTEAVLIENGCAGSLAELRSTLGPGPALFRVAGRPSATKADAIVLGTHDGVEESLVERVMGILEQVGAVERVPVQIFAAAATVAESSIGLMCVALQGIEEGAVGAGLSTYTARAFVRQTLLATALLLQRHSGSPADLKDQVASPGGTTIAGLGALEDRAVRGALLRAVETGTERRLETARRG